MSLATIRAKLVAARSDAVAINSPDLPKIDAALAECDALIAVDTPPPRERLTASNEVTIVGTYASPGNGGQNYLVTLGPQTNAMFIAKGVGGFATHWDPHEAVEDAPAGATTQRLTRVDTLKPGEMFCIEADKSTRYYTLDSIDEVDKRIAFHPPLPTNSDPLYAGWPKGAHLSRVGNWLDRDGAFRGANHFVDQPWSVGAFEQTFDISTVDGDLYIPANLKLTGAYIDDAIVPAFLMNLGAIDPSDIKATPDANSRTIIKNPTRGRVLKLKRSVSTAARVVIDKVIGPEIPRYPWIDIPNAVEPDLLDFEPTSFAALKAAGFVNSQGNPLHDVGENNNMTPYCESPEYGVESSGMRFLRCRDRGFSPTTNPSGAYFPPQLAIDWYWRLPTPLREVFLQYVFQIEEDWIVHMNDGGIKFPGVKSDILDDTATFSTRPLLGGWCREHPRFMRFRDYTYNTHENITAGDGVYSNSGDAGPARARRKTPRGAAIEVGRYYAFNQHVRLNDVINGVPQFNGAKNWAINGNPILVCEDFAYRGANNATRLIQWIAMNLFHGGRALPSADRPDSLHINFGDIHVRIGSIRVSTKPIAIPRNVIPLLA